MIVRKKLIQFLPVITAYLEENDIPSFEYEYLLWLIRLYWEHEILSSAYTLSLTFRCSVDFVCMRSKPR